ncbi:MAG: hypothetical protein HY731_10120 [Candidatus Tectomicrobia bacterium]|nr:hypothetical protein [Candidatus Tectomicrobia bacterium]
MVNPFQEFQEHSIARREIPLDRIISVKDQILERLIAGYQKLVEEEVRGLVWVVERGTLSRAYVVAQQAIAGIDFTLEDIEDLCYELDKSKRIPFAIGGPTGLYISALFNQIDAPEITLRLNDLKGKLYLLGYRLPEGKRLILEGDAGDFIGVGLEGGEVIVKGSTGDWTGVGMKRGKLVVEKNVGSHTGEWMSGGEIHVMGRIGGLGRISGGRIFEGERLVSPMGGGI